MNSKWGMGFLFSKDLDPEVGMGATHRDNQ